MRRLKVHGTSISKLLLLGKLNHTKDSDQPTVFKYLITLFIQKHRHQFKTILTEKEYKIDYF
jgi:hypothetical protein